jgi:pimeloyl-ACP methyl ester carboxylesterase
MDLLARTRDHLLETFVGPNAPGGSSGSKAQPKFADLAGESVGVLSQARTDLLRIARRQMWNALRAAARSVDSALPSVEAADLRTAAEYLGLHAALVYYGSGVPRGDASGVLLIPGFLSTDVYMLELYAWLRRIGYRPYFSGIGLNAECPDLLVKHRLNQTIDRALDETGRRIHIIGHSLGGVIARSIACQRTADVASVITLGAPFRDGGVLHSRVLQAAEIVRRRILLEHGPRVLDECYTGRCSCDFVTCARGGVPAATAQTAVYTRDDRVIDWRYCKTGDPKVDVEVTGTHAGLVFNALVFEIIGSRLAARKKTPRGRRPRTALAAVREKRAADSRRQART